MLTDIYDYIVISRYTRVYGDSAWALKVRSPNHTYNVALFQTRAEAAQAKYLLEREF